ncbi:MAG TPA: MTAP family purine nucleoside phosphorylase [Fimbriimonas sp.]
MQAERRNPVSPRPAAIDVGIIGGTGTGDLLLALPGEPMHVPTPYGVLRGRVLRTEGYRIFLTNRHTAGHKVPPHRVNYQALAEGMRRLGVRACLATAAVGSLRADWGAGTFVACSDFLDFTARNLTMFERTVEHRDFTEPFDPRCRDAFVQSGRALGFPVQERGIYVCGNGPRYETPHEIATIQRLGGELVGMTAASEAILMREAGVAYGCLAVVTNLAAGISSTPLSHEEVVEEMLRSGERAVQILLQTVRLLAE